MATPAAIQAQIDSAATGRVANITRSEHIDGTYDGHYVVGVMAPYVGRSLWVRTTAAQTAAQQASTITTALAAFR
jgi:hypothetical protein